MTNSLTSSPSPVALTPGEQPPRIRHCPTRNGVEGQRVYTVAHRCGLALDPWQRDILYDALSTDAITGMWLTPRVAVSVPRQNGKGAIIEALELAFLLGAFPDARLLIHSAHEYKTAQNGFQRLLSYFDTVPALAKARDEGRVKIGTAAAREFITIDGRTVKFLARSKGSGRGFSADFLILDEAQELSEDVWAAIIPTISARPNPQVWLFGTPPNESMNGEVFTRLRDGGITGTDARLAYFEWSPDEDDDIADPTVWAKCNPAFGLRISEAAIRDEFNSMDEDTFGRERLGMWDGVGVFSVIPEDAWHSLVSDAVVEGRVAFAVDVSPDRKKASIGVAGHIAGDRVMVQVIDNRKGVGWVAGRLRELTDRWPHVAVIIDSAGPAASLLPDLKKAGVKRIKVIGSNEMKAACGAFYDLAIGTPPYVDETGTEYPGIPARLAHPDQPGLNDAIAAARKRPLGDAWAWHRKDNTTDITPLVAVTLAAFGLASRTRAARGPSKVLVL